MRPTLWIDGTPYSIAVLLTGLGLNLSGWTLSSAVSVSDDGRAIAGYGFHNGQAEGWVATIPAPSAAATIALVVAIAPARRRRRERARQRPAHA